MGNAVALLLGGWRLIWDGVSKDSFESVTSKKEFCKHNKWKIR